MPRYSEAFKPDVRRRMSPPQRQSVAQVAAELGIHVVTLYSWRKASLKDPEGWGPAEKFTVVIEAAGLNTTALSPYCRDRGLYPEQVDRWSQAAQDANAQPLLTKPSRRIWRSVTRPISGKSNGCSRSCAVRTRPWRRRHHC